VKNEGMSKTMYLLTIKHYLKRSFNKPIELALMTLLPTGIIAINVLMNLHIMDTQGFETMYENYDITATAITMMIMLMFQFMSGVYTGEYIFEDIRGVNRWRLGAAPVSTAVFVVGAITASMVFSLFTAAFVLTVGYFFFDIYLGNIGIIAAITFLAALMSQFWGIIIALFVKAKKSIDGITIVISFAMSAMVGGFFVNVPVPAFIQNYIVPTGVALRGIWATSVYPLRRYNFDRDAYGYIITDYSLLDINASLISIAILAGITIIFGILAFAIAKAGGRKS